jgi:nanoRNase/pAp phosphatase (c-di-AMP/oligoRNAs hydrolase)
MAARFDELVALLSRAPGELFIQTHDVPDPDAIAAAHGLRLLLKEKGIESRIVYAQEIEKADSRKMLELFDIQLWPYSCVSDVEAEDWVVLVDVQKGNTNLRCLNIIEVASIDHHELKADAGYRFIDVRPDVGASSSIVAQYYFESGIMPSRLCATALLYGIFVDTDNLTRAVSPLDVEMFYHLHAYSDPELIKKIRGNQITLADLRLYAEAFRTVEVYGPMAFLKLDDANDGLIGASSDIVLSLEGVDLAIAYSLRPSGVKISVRSINAAMPANAFVRSLVEDMGFGGGHNHMAGGFIPVERLPADKSIDTIIKYKAIRVLEGLNA